MINAWELLLKAKKIKDANNNIKVIYVVEHRVEFDHKEKRLFQVSDMLTFMDKIVYKHNHNIPLTRSEKYFFSVKDILGIIRQLKNKRL